MRRRSSIRPRARLRDTAAVLVAALLPGSAALAGAPGPVEEPAPAVVQQPTPTAPPATASAAEQATIWQSLHYRGTAIVGEFSADLELAPPRNPSSAAPRWIAALRTRMKSALLPDKETTIRAWFDPVTAAIDRFEKLKLGPGPSYKRFLLREDGVDRFRKEPGFGEDPRRHETWAHEKQIFLPFVAASHGCRLISDPGVLVYLVSFGPGRWGEDPRRLRAVGQDALPRVAAGGGTLDPRRALPRAWRRSRRRRARGAGPAESLRGGGHAGCG